MTSMRHTPQVRTVNPAIGRVIIKNGIKRRTTVVGESKDGVVRSHVAIGSTCLAVLYVKISSDR